MTDVSITIDKHQLQKIVDTLENFNSINFGLPNVRGIRVSDAIPVVLKNLIPVLDCANVIDVMTFRTNKVSNFTISGTTCTYLIGILVGMEKHGMIKNQIF